jgi:microcystin-dependent protein
MIGGIIQFAGSVVPNGYLLCDGAAVSRTDYADLFSVIGTTYGNGDNSTTFNLPNLSGKVAMGNGGGRSLGNTGGEESHLLISSEMPSHSHVAPSHTHGIDLSVTTPVLAHSITTQPAFNYTRLNGTAARDLWGSGYSCYTGRQNRTRTYGTNMAVAAHPASDCTVTGGISNHAAFDTEPDGDGGAHNNMMPYLALNFIICARK